MVYFNVALRDEEINDRIGIIGKVVWWWGLQE